MARADQRRQPLQHELDGIFEAGRLTASGRIGELDRLGSGSCLDGFCNEAGGQHLFQDDARTCEGEHRTGGWRVFRGRLQDAREHGCFRQRQRTCRLVEIAAGGSLDTVGAATEIDAVEIELENVLFRQAHLEPDGEQQLLELAPQGALGREKQVLGQLLGERRAALHVAAGAQVGEACPEQADGVEPPVIEEAAILGCNNCLDDVLRQQIERHELVVLPTFGQHAAIAGQDPHDRRRITLAQRHRIGKADRVIDQRQRQGAAANDGEDEQQGKAAAHETRHPAPLAG